MNLADYDKKYKTGLEARVKNLKDKAHKAKAFDGEQRLGLIAQHFSQLSLEQAYILLNPEAFRREVEEVQAYRRRPKFAQNVRTVLGLAPLIVTWGSLSWAVLQYGNYVNTHPQDQGHVLSFLQLWQNGALGSLTFFWTGILDVSLLFLFLGFSLYSLQLEYHARIEAEKFANDLQVVGGELMEAVVKEGQSGSLSDVDLQRVVRFIKEAIAESYQDLGELVDKAKDTIVKAGETVEILFDQQIKPMLADFNSNLKSFHNDVNTLNSKVKELVDASNAMVGSASAMAASTSSMASSARSLVTNLQAQTQINKDMDTHLIQLNKTEGQMIQTLDVTQRAIAAEVRKAADKVEESATKLETAAGKVESVGRQLATINPQNVQRIIDNAKTFADRAEQVALELQKAAKTISSAIRSPWWKRMLGF